MQTGWATDVPDVRMSRMKQISTIYAAMAQPVVLVRLKAFSCGEALSGGGAKTIVLAHDSGFDVLAEKVASAYALPGAQTVPSARREAKSEARRHLAGRASSCT